MLNIWEDVGEFSRKFGMIVNTKPKHLTQIKLQERIAFLREELDEFVKGCDTQNLDEQADALVDLVYVAIGTAHMLGLPWEELWNDVHRANMSKVRGVTKRNHLVDCTKPEGWIGPKTLEILVNHGYNPASKYNVKEHCDDSNM